MKQVAKFDNALNNGKTLAEQGINQAIYDAYRKCLPYGYKYLNFDEVIWDKDIEPIVATCRKVKFTHITISSNQCGIAEVLWKFQELGCTIEGLMKVQKAELFCGCREVAAILVKIN